MDRVQVIAVISVSMLLVIVFEAIRKRRLQERYALVWLLTGIVLLVLALRRDLLTLLSGAIGIYYPPSALLVVGMGFVVIVLLSFSIVVSELSEKVTRLAQSVALLESEVLAWREAATDQTHGSLEIKTRVQRDDREWVRTTGP